MNDTPRWFRDELRRMAQEEDAERRAIVPAVRVLTPEEAREMARRELARWSIPAERDALNGKR